MASLFRAKWLLIPAVLILIVGGYAAWNYLSKWESTDDAQVDGVLGQLDRHARVVAGRGCRRRHAQTFGSLLPHARPVHMQQQRRPGDRCRD